MTRSPRSHRATRVSSGSLCLLALCAVAAAAGPIDSTALMLEQRALDLRNPLTVLTITLRPGEEDLATLAYLRMGLGAKIMNAYVTNGESGEQDRVWEYAPFLAARRRDAAAEAMRSIETEAYFLGMPDILPDDTTRALGRWSSDTLLTRLVRTISQFRPDVVLMFRDPEMGPRNPLYDTVRAALLRAVERTFDPTPSVAAAARPRFDRWTVLRVFEEGDGPLVFPLNRKHPVLGKSYSGIGSELAEEFSFMASRLRRWERSGMFRRIFPQKGGPDRDVDQKRLGLVPSKYASIARTLSDIAAGMRRSRRDRDAVLRQIVAAVDSIEKAMRYVLEISHRDRRLLTHWKVRLEDARIALLGVRVRYAWSETVLTDRQLTHFRVDTILNLPPGGTTELYVPAVQSGWGLDENIEAWLPLEYGREYRILSPGGLPQNLPHWEKGLSRYGVGNPFLVAIVHRGKTREKSFMYRINTRFSYTSRFTTEFLTPIVRVIPEERFIARLTNHSRDGVADELVVGDSTVFVPSSMEFALSFKEATVTDTLLLRGLPAGLAYGNYLVPVRIGPIPVGELGARHFPVAADSTRRVWVLTNREDPPVWQTLRRLGVSSRRLIHAADLEGMERGSCDVLVVDRNALLTMPEHAQKKQILRRFITDGGHLLILAQDAVAWSTAPLVDGISLTPAVEGWRVQQVVADSSRYPFASPNTIGADLTLGWSHRTYYNTIAASRGTAPAAEGEPQVIQVLLSSPDGTPLIVTSNERNGRWTYVDLALDAQWMNIDPAAFRLLANLISGK